MNNEITSEHLLDQQRIQAAEEARRRVQAYIALTAFHAMPAGFENDDDQIEGKNS